MKNIPIPAALALCSSLLVSHANTYLVTTTVDPGPGSLSQAILDANAHPGPDIIQFQFAAYPVTIVPAAPLPDILDAVTIDATDPSVCMEGTKPRVNIDGSVVGGVNIPGLAVHTPLPVTIKGLAVYAFSGPGLLLDSNTGSKIAGNHLGTDASGTLFGAGNGRAGILLSQCSDVVVGGSKPCERNVISANRGGGVDIFGGSHNQVLGNFIGPAFSGTWALPNQYGVMVNAGTQHQIGSVNAGEPNVISGNAGDAVMMSGPLGVPSNNHVEGNYIGTQTGGGIPLPNSGNGVYFFGGPTGNFIRYNRIAFNNSDGVLVLEGTDNTIVENSISDNVRLGIDITPMFAVNPNDPMDADAGPNRQQNYPGFSPAIPPMSGASGTSFQVSLNSEPSTTFELDFYWNPSCDPTGYGEGKHFFAKTNVTTDALGNFPLTLMTFTMPVPLGSVLTATATHPGGSTSEFCPCSPPVVALGSNIVNHAGLPHQPDGTATLTPQTNGTLRVSGPSGGASNGVQIALGSARGWMGSFSNLQVSVGGGMKMSFLGHNGYMNAVQWMGDTELHLPTPGMAEVHSSITPAGSFMLRAQLISDDGQLLDSTLIPNGGTYPVPVCASNDTLHVRASGVLRLSSGAPASYFQIEDDGPWCGTRPGPHPPHFKLVLISAEMLPAGSRAKGVPKDDLCTKCPACCFPYDVTFDVLKFHPDPPCDCPWEVFLGPELVDIFQSLHQVLGGETLFAWEESGPRPHPWLPGTLTVESLNLNGESGLDLIPTRSSIPLPPTDGGVDPHDSSALARFVSIDFNADPSPSASVQIVRFLVDGPVPVGPGDPVEHTLEFKSSERGWAVSATFGASGASSPMAQLYFHGAPMGQPMPLQGLQVPSLPARVAASTSVSPFGAPGWALYWPDAASAAGPQPLPWDEMHIMTTAGMVPIPWYIRFRVKWDGIEAMTITGEQTLSASPGSLSIQRLQNAASLSYPTEPGRPYRIEYSSTLASPAWQTLEDFMGDGSVHHVSDTSQPGPMRFYRLVGF